MVQTHRALEILGDHGGGTFPSPTVNVDKNVWINLSYMTPILALRRNGEETQAFRLPERSAAGCQAL